MSLRQEGWSLCKLSCAYEASGNPVTVQIPIQCNLGWGLGFCTSNKLSLDAHAASITLHCNFSSGGPGHHFIGRQEAPFLAPVKAVLASGGAGSSGNRMFSQRRGCLTAVSF